MATYMPYMLVLVSWITDLYSTNIQQLRMVTDHSQKAHPLFGRSNPLKGGGLMILLTNQLNSDVEISNSLQLVTTPPLLQLSNNLQQISTSEESVNCKEILKYFNLFQDKIGCWWNLQLQTNICFFYRNKILPYSSFSSSSSSSFLGWLLLRQKSGKWIAFSNIPPSSS